MSYPTLNIDFNKVYASNIKFETQVNTMETGAEQRYPAKIYPIREFTLTFEKNFAGREALENFFAQVYGGYGLFYWTWPTAKGGNGVQYTCWFDADSLKQSIKKLGYSETELKIVCIDRTSYTPPSSFDFWHKAETTAETLFYTIIDKAVTAASTGNRRKIWDTPLKRWVLEFEKNETVRKQLESFFIAKRGRFKYFPWTWETDRGGDGQTYNVRFDADDLNTEILQLGHGKIQLPIREVRVTSPAPDAAIEKDEIVPRKLLFIDIPDNPIRIIDNDTLESLTFNGEQYLGAPLDFSDFKKADTSEVTKIKATVSNVNGAISNIVGTNGDIVTNADCYIYQVFLNTSNYTLLPTIDQVLFVGKANHLELTTEVATLEIEPTLGGFEKKAPFMTYGVSCQYRKFKDVRCGYSGPETYCDRTLTNCQRLGNSERFGGFPSLPIQQVIKA